MPAAARRYGPCPHARTMTSLGGTTRCVACGDVAAPMGTKKPPPVIKKGAGAAKTPEILPQIMPLEPQTWPQPPPFTYAPAFHHGAGVPPIHVLCATCKTSAWARLERFPGRILCTFCWPPPTWDTLLDRQAA